MAKVEFLKDSLTPNINRLPMQIEKGVAQVLLFQAPRLSAYAKSNAPWTDRTTNARNGLGTRTGIQTDGKHFLALFHKVPYGIWLEVRFGQKNAIIMPSIEVFGPQVMLSLTGLFARLGIKTL